MLNNTASAKALRAAIRDGFGGINEELRKLNSNISLSTDALKTLIELMAADTADYTGEADEEKTDSTD